MCGRYEFNVEDRLLAHFYSRIDPTEAIQTGTVFPGEQVLVLGLNRNGQVRSTAMRWGFDGVGNDSRLLINARSETIMEKPTFAESFHNRRCLFPMSQFYEWSPAPNKEKYLFGANDPLFVAGCYQMKETPYGFQAQAVILTRFANAVVGPVHHRMPVIIQPNDIRQWLDDFQFARDYLVVDHAPELMTSKVPTQ
ncbi:MAG: SOS response-associated peptidase family protein [Aerococcus sp.]|nr:SOS response-associated peptidase family protein [Aerococcus sp.]